jgi:hypothetical protein
MPIRNVGTLLENLVVTESGLALLRKCCHDRTPFDFVNSVAMPPCSPWRPHHHDGGFDAATLKRVRCATDPALLQGYAGLLRATLRSDIEQGPSAALLVAGSSLQKGVPCRMWLNDIRNGHYGDAIPQLKRITAKARAIYKIKGVLTVRISDAPYPNSIMDLARVLQEWNPLPGARLGFLDPMRYRMQDRKDVETSSKDHRCWLAQIAFDGLTCAVHFTGHSDQRSLEQELRSLHDDAVAEGYTASRAFKRQHYVAFLAEPERIAAAISAEASHHR